ncbi:beta-galactosidase-1-like protein 3 [Cylas formicarius]|uniref:beta-galactosidase-1-like protein 3 n=1 Tax=Cylas formicarius TaxID=197179 RepID=UPI002958B3EE|nr:beta-galactosidase-1-like protein 3 [Cylas formicarius]
MRSCLLLPLVICVVANSRLPTNYEYYGKDEILSGLSAAQRHFLLNGENITLFSGTFHYFRVHRTQWRDRLRKMRAAGLNAIETYVPWNLHEYQSGVYDFGDGGSDFEEFLDVEEFLRTVQEEDLFAIVRPGPYICAEWEFGGLPSWLLREKGMKVRTSDGAFLKYVSRYFSKVIPILEKHQFTNGGPIIAFQVENEYGATLNYDKAYLRAIKEMFIDHGIKELMFTADSPLLGLLGGLPGDLLVTGNFNAYPEFNLQVLRLYQMNKPLMVAEYWSGWYDHVTEDHRTTDTETYSNVLERIISFPASVNIYMFVGGTNFGFTHGSNFVSTGSNNSGLQPETTSYDYDSPISENGDLTEKFNATKALIEKYSPIKTLLPDIPESPKRVKYEDIKIEEQLLLSTVIDEFPNKIASEDIVPMELLDINNSSGQSYGYIVYRKSNIDLKAGAVLKIKGYVRDHALVLVNGVLLNRMLSSRRDIDGFGYWRLHNSSLTLTEKDLTNATVDLVIENNSRNNFGQLDQFEQYKGLTEEVLIDEEVIKNWQIVPLEFKRSWNEQLSGWKPISNRRAPALYRATFNATLPLSDTYINVQEWRKGIIIINGFVLGRYVTVGPQLALYLPGGLLRDGENELIVFEHFSAPLSVKFSDQPLWGLGNYIH